MFHRCWTFRQIDVLSTRHQHHPSLQWLTSACRFFASAASPENGNEDVHGSGSLSEKSEKSSFNLVLPPVKLVRPSRPRVIGLESINNPTMLTLTRERATLLLRIKNMFDSQERTRVGFLNVIEEFLRADKSKRGHIEFIFSAIKRLEEFCVERDYEVYQRLLDVFPIHRFYPRSRLDAAWPRYQPQIDAAVALLERMDYFGVIPTYDTVKKLQDILGEGSPPVEKALQMGWWHSMMQDANPYDIGGLERYRPFVLAGLVLKRMAGQKSAVHIVRGEDPEGKVPWVLSIQSKRQTDRARRYQFTDLPLFVEGPRCIYVHKQPQYYYVLLTDPALSGPESDDRDEATALSICMTPIGTAETLTCWLDSLKEKYPVLKEVSYVYNAGPIPDTPYSCYPEVTEPLPPGEFPAGSEAPEKIVSKTERSLLGELGRTFGYQRSTREQSDVSPPDTA